MTHLGFTVGLLAGLPLGALLLVVAAWLHGELTWRKSRPREEARFVRAVSGAVTTPRPRAPIRGRA